MRKPKENEQICTYHQYIRDKAYEIMKIKDNSYDEIKDLLWEVQDVADDICDVVLLALEAGQNMENRLKEYREAIKELGFIRDK